LPASGKNNIMCQDMESRAIDLLYSKLTKA